MKLLKNERGYVLVLTLLTITLMFPLGTLLLTANLNSATQMRQTEAFRSSIATAEMGITFVEASIGYKLDKIIDETLDDILETVNASGGGKRDVNVKIADTMLSEFPQIRKFPPPHCLEQECDVEEDGMQSFEINVNFDKEDITEDEIVFNVSSIGSTETTFLIETDVVIATDMELGFGDVGFDDPRDFPSIQDITSDMRASIDALVNDNISNESPDNNFGRGSAFESSIRFTANNPRLNPNSSLSVRGDLIISNAFAINRGSVMDIRGSARFRSGLNSEGQADHRFCNWHVGDWREEANLTVDSIDNRVCLRIAGSTFTSGVSTDYTETEIGGSMAVAGRSTFVNSTLEADGHFFTSSPVTIRNSEVEIGGHVGLSDSSIVITNSDFTIKGRRVPDLPEIKNVSAMNQPQITDRSNVETGNLRLNNMTLTNSSLDVKGSMRLEGSGGSVTNSSMTVRGHVLAGNDLLNEQGMPNGGSPLVLDNNSRMIVYGNFTSRQLNMVRDSLLIVHGDFHVNQWNSIFRHDASNSRIIVFGNNLGSSSAEQYNFLVRDEISFEDAMNYPLQSRLNGIFFVDDEPQSPPPSLNGIIDWNWLNSDLRNIEYIGRP